MKITAYETAFDVKGYGSFPVDMLRYDTCYPASEVEAHKIERTFDDPSATWTIRLIRRSKVSGSPTVMRWASFGCEIRLVDVGEVY